MRKDSGINKVEDLKGKVIGTNGGGSAVDVAVRAMLKKHGLEDKRDYTMLEGPLPAMPAMLLEKKVDLIPAVLPFALNPKLRAEGKVLFDLKDAMGTTQMIVWTARKSFIDKHRAAMVDYLEDMLRVTRWYLDPKNHDEVARLRPRSPRCRRSVSAGCSPSRTPIAIRSCCRTSMRFSATSIPRGNSAS